MIFRETGLPGSFVIEPECLQDERGFFARVWCSEEFDKHGLAKEMVQASVSFNKKKGTLRGMHYSVPPARETKLVRCTLGAITDVIIDLRPKSDTFLKHIMVNLSADNLKALYIPPGFAHGFQTLKDNSEVFYMMNDSYKPDCGRGVRWDDPAFGIKWPEDERTIIERDNNYPDFDATNVKELESYC